MSLFNNLFTNHKITLNQLKEMDPNFDKIFQFINIVSSIEERDKDYSTIVIEFSKTSISCKYGQYNDTSMVCIARNMIHKGNCDETGGNTLIGKDIKADELPQGTGISFHFNEEKNEYDYYELVLELPILKQIGTQQYMSLALQQLQTDRINVKSSYYKNGQGKITIRWFSS